MFSLRSEGASRSNAPTIHMATILALYFLLLYFKTLYLMLIHVFTGLLSAILCVTFMLISIYAS